MIRSFTLICLVATFAPIHFSIAQEKSATVDPSGTWRWQYDLNGETLKDSLRINLEKENAVVGEYRGRAEKPVEIKDGKMNGESLSFHFTFDYQGNTLKAEFQGKIKGDDIDGNVNITTSEGAREFPWAPKRSVEMEDTIGSWQIKIETPNGTLEPTLDISKDQDKYVGRYRSGDRIDVQVTNLKIENNNLVFTMMGEVDGTKIKGDYKGRSYGDKIQGSIAYELGDRTGDIDFTATRKPKAK